MSGNLNQLHNLLDSIAIAWERIPVHKQKACYTELLGYEPVDISINIISDHLVKLIADCHWYHLNVALDILTNYTNLGKWIYCHHLNCVVCISMLKPDSEIFTNSEISEYQNFRIRNRLNFELHLLKEFYRIYKPNLGLTEKISLWFRLYLFELLLIRYDTQSDISALHRQWATVQDYICTIVSERAILATKNQFHFCMPDFQ